MARAAGGGRDYRIAVVDSMGEVRSVIAGFPSVTTIIHDADASSVQALMGWASNVAIDAVVYLAADGHDVASMTAQAIKAEMKKANLGHNAKRDKAASRGTDVHDWAEQLLLGKMTTDDVRAKMADAAEPGYGDALLAWHERFEKEGSTVEATEPTLVSLTHEFAGTADLVYTTKDGALRVADFKTAKGIYDTHVVQCDAYALMVEEMRARSNKPVTVAEVEVIRFGADGKVQSKTARPRPEVFLAMLGLYKAQARRKEDK